MRGSIDLDLSANMFIFEVACEQNGDIRTAVCLVFVSPVWHLRSFLQQNK